MDSKLTNVPASDTSDTKVIKDPDQVFSMNNSEETAGSHPLNSQNTMSTPDADEQEVLVNYNKHLPASQESSVSMLTSFRKRLKQHLVPSRSASLHKSMHDLSLSPKKNLSSSFRNDPGSRKPASTVIPSSSTGSISNLTQDVPEDISNIQNEHEAALQNVSSLTASQVQLIQSTWGLVKQHIEKIGVITFLGIFEQHSDFRDAFTEFRRNKFADVKHDPAMQVHGLRVLSIMDKLVTRLPKTDDIERQLMAIGAKHCRYVPTIGLISSVSDQLWGAIEPVLKEEGLWTDSLADTWRTVLDYLTKTVRYGLAKTFRSTTWN
ncbi:unnamed protein product [Heterobilharzia americana]|nr:unnamed protein product [Heterobilharzia americana]